MSGRFYVRIGADLTGYNVTQGGYKKDQRVALKYNEQHTPMMLEPKVYERNKLKFG